MNQFWATPVPMIFLHVNGRCMRVVVNGSGALPEDSRLAVRQSLLGEQLADNKPIKTIPVNSFKDFNI